MRREHDPAVTLLATVALLSLNLSSLWPLTGSQLFPASIVVREISRRICQIAYLAC